MDNQIIDTCKEANGELLSHNSSALHHGPRLLNPTSGFNRQWSLSQLLAEFGELCQWLTHVQEEIYSSPENLSSRKLRMVRTKTSTCFRKGTYVDAPENSKNARRRSILVLEIDPEGS
ncbi:uncharacterized protein LOC135081860 [Ostrinia nubilalis]|uniref:uncharacterized protein LOC135081860 n=1 Tax=Ostrinia nubilalis TaxID=29057 RepID=UPI0030823B2C